jgi:transcription elongation factor GreA
MNEYEQLEEEIIRLKHELSDIIPQEMQDAIELGDLRENSEFSELVTRQHFVSIRLKQLTDRLALCKSINVQNISRDSVGIGSLIKTRHLETNAIEYFKLVLSEISDDVYHTYTEITLKSPLGKALNNKKVKDEVVAKLPNGKATYRILKITTIHDF